MLMIASGGKRTSSLPAPSHAGNGASAWHLDDSSEATVYLCVRRNGIDNMDHREAILEKIWQAMEFACEQSELFTGSKADTISAEYLFTVAVAMAIAEHNGPPGEPYVIRVERDAATFMKDCVRPIKFAGQFKSRMIRAEDPDIRRPGRVDVTVYMDVPNSGHFGVRPLCAIELKGFDPGAGLVRADLERNLGFLRTTGPTGDSVLEFAVFAALHSYGRYRDEQVRGNEQRTRDKYKGYLEKLGNLSDINVDIKVKSVSVEQAGTVIQGIDYDELDTSSRHHFVGAMVVMSRAMPSGPT